MAGQLVIENLEKYFPVPQTGVRAFLNPFSPLTHPAFCWEFLFTSEPERSPA